MSDLFGNLARHALGVPADIAALPNAEEMHDVSHRRTMNWPDDRSWNDLTGGQNRPDAPPRKTGGGADAPPTPPRADRDEDRKEAPSEDPEHAGAAPVAQLRRDGDVGANARLTPPQDAGDALNHGGMIGNGVSAAAGAGPPGASAAPSPDAETPGAAGQGAPTFGRAPPPRRSERDPRSAGAPPAGATAPSGRDTTPDTNGSAPAGPENAQARPDGQPVATPRDVAASPPSNGSLRARAPDAAMSGGDSSAADSTQPSGPVSQRKTPPDHPHVQGPAVTRHSPESRGGESADEPMSRSPTPPDIPTSPPATPGQSAEASTAPREDDGTGRQARRFHDAAPDPKSPVTHNDTPATPQKPVRVALAGDPAGKSSTTEPRPVERDTTTPQTSLPGDEDQQQTGGAHETPLPQGTRAAGDTAAPTGRDIAQIRSPDTASDASTSTDAPAPADRGGQQTAPQTTDSDARDTSEQRVSAAALDRPSGAKAGASQATPMLTSAPVAASSSRSEVTEPTPRSSRASEPRDNDVAGAFAPSAAAPQETIATDTPKPPDASAPGRDQDASRTHAETGRAGLARMHDQMQPSPPPATSPADPTQPDPRPQAGPGAKPSAPSNPSTDEPSTTRNPALHTPDGHAPGGAATNALSTNAPRDHAVGPTGARVQTPPEAPGAAPDTPVRATQASQDAPQGVNRLGPEPSGRAAGAQTHHETPNNAGPAGLDTARPVGEPMHSLPASTAPLAPEIGDVAPDAANAQGHLPAASPAGLRSQADQRTSPPRPPHSDPDALSAEHAEASGHGAGQEPNGGRNAERPETGAVQTTANQSSSAPKTVSPTLDGGSVRAAKAVTSASARRPTASPATPTRKRAGDQGPVAAPSANAGLAPQNRAQDAWPPQDGAERTPDARANAAHHLSGARKPDRTAPKTSKGHGGALQATPRGVDQTETRGAHRPTRSDGGPLVPRPSGGRTAGAPNALNPEVTHTDQPTSETRAAGARATLAPAPRSAAEEIATAKTTGALPKKPTATPASAGAKARGVQSAQTDDRPALPNAPTDQHARADRPAAAGEIATSQKTGVSSTKPAETRVAAGAKAQGVLTASTVKHPTIPKAAADKPRTIASTTPGAGAPRKAGATDTDAPAPSPRRGDGGSLNSRPAGPPNAANPKDAQSDQSAPETRTVGARAKPAPGPLSAAEEIATAKRTGALSKKPAETPASAGAKARGVPPAPTDDRPALPNAPADQHARADRPAVAGDIATAEKSGASSKKPADTTAPPIQRPEPAKSAKDDRPRLPKAPAEKSRTIAPTTPGINARRKAGAADGDAPAPRQDAAPSIRLGVFHVSSAAAPRLPRRTRPGAQRSLTDILNARRRRG